jgi:hypothetical protein
MAVDPKANAAYIENKAIKFNAGDTVWVSGLEFRVVGIQDGQLVLAPVNVNL